MYVTKINKYSTNNVRCCSNNENNSHNNNNNNYDSNNNKWKEWKLLGHDNYRSIWFCVAVFAYVCMYMCSVENLQLHYYNGKVNFVIMFMILYCGQRHRCVCVCICTYMFVCLSSVYALKAIMDSTRQKKRRQQSLNPYITAWKTLTKLYTHTHA